MTDIPDKIYLSEDELPTQYCSLRADMKEKPPNFPHSTAASVLT